MKEHVLTAPVEPITAPVRSTAVDIVKGIAILLVVMEHTAQGMFSRGWWVGMNAYLTDLYVYSFHMPAFFFVAGLFLAGSIQRRGPSAFTADKAKTILYPYLVWAVLYAGLDPFISRFKAGPSSFHLKSFLLAVLSGNVAWFLPVLFCCQIVMLCTWKMPAWLRLVLAVVASILMPTLGPEVMYKTVWYMSFMAGGMLVGRSIFKLRQVPVWAAALGAIILFAALAVVVIKLGGNVQFGVPPQRLAVTLGFVGTAGLFLIARVIEGTRFGDAWAWTGRASLGIFLMAPFPQGAAREMLVRWAHTDAFWPQLLVPTLFATLLPAIVWHQQERLRIGWLFHWPDRR
jgi:fucose 4-O-acetylase-like acetyltransferase